MNTGDPESESRRQTGTGLLESDLVLILQEGEEQCLPGLLIPVLCQAWIPESWTLPWPALIPGLL